MLVRSLPSAAHAAGRGKLLADESPEDGAAALAALKARLGTSEGLKGIPRFGLDEGPVDAFLQGGLKRACVHEVAARAGGDAGAAFLFALALAFRAADHGRPILLVIADDAIAESGAPDGHGLAAHGFDPSRLVVVRARRPLEALWAFEEGLRCPALAVAVVALARLPEAYDLTLSRRFTLAARENGVTGVLGVLSQGGAADALASAAETRWRIGARPSRRGLAGETQTTPPLTSVLAADLKRRRGGDPCDLQLEWIHDARRFVPHSLIRPALPGAVAATPADRSHPAPGAAGIACRTG